MAGGTSFFNVTGHVLTELLGRWQSFPTHVDMTLGGFLPVSLQRAVRTEQ